MQQLAVPSTAYYHNLPLYYIVRYASIPTVAGNIDPVLFRILATKDEQRKISILNSKRRTNKLQLSVFVARWSVCTSVFAGGDIRPFSTYSHLNLSWQAALSSKCIVT